jgi:hypothetical protein
LVSIGEIIDEVFRLIPAPSNLFEWTWTGIGVLFSAAFSRVNNQGLDEALQDTNCWKEKLGKIGKWLGSRLLHFIHHWWAGLLFVIYCGTTAFYEGMPKIPFPELYWLGVGMFLEDAVYHTAASFKDGIMNKIIRSLSRVK